MTNQQAENRNHKGFKAQDNEEAMQKMPLFVCTCGTSILIVPDLPAMDKAIERHVKEHFELTGQRISQDCLSKEILKTVAFHLG